MPESVNENQLKKKISPEEKPAKGLKFSKGRTPPSRSRVKSIEEPTLIRAPVLGPARYLKEPGVDPEAPAILIFEKT